MSERWDAIVVGAGPAGTTAARLLAQRGRRVLILEKRGMPRDKACGDGLIPDALQFLRGSGLYQRVAAAGCVSRRVRIFSPRRFNFALQGEFLCVPRIALDTILLDAAVEAGAELRVGTVRTIRIRGPLHAEVYLGPADSVLSSRVVILATGADVHLAKGLGLVERERESAVAFRGYLDAIEPLDELIVSFDRSITPGYAWVFPGANGRCNVGCGVFHGSTPHMVPDFRAMLSDFLSGFPPAVRHFGRNAASRVQGARGARIRCNLSGVAPTDNLAVLVTGESIGTTFALTGEGIGKAMESAAVAAEVAAAAILTDDAAALCRYVELLSDRLRPKYASYKTAERWLTTNWVNDLLSWRVARSPFLRRSLSGILDESIDPATVFSPIGVVRAMLT